MVGATWDLLSRPLFPDSIGHPALEVLNNPTVADQANHPTSLQGTSHFMSSFNFNKSIKFLINIQNLAYKIDKYSLSFLFLTGPVPMAMLPVMVIAQATSSSQ